MPVPKKPRLRKPSAAKPPADQPLPDPRAMEAWLAALGRGSRDSSIAKAQNVMYDAWDRTSSRARITLARKALLISPLCADAYNLLAQEAKSPSEARDLYARAVEAGRLALGPEGFKEYAGQFWGFLETRPYMRARHGLALTLCELGEEEAAIGHFREMLDLNPNDNQGIRYLLLGSLLRRDDIEGLKQLLGAYADEWSPYWLYTRALIAYREGCANEPATLKLLKDARTANRHVPAILAGTTPPVAAEGGYITAGGADEASEYVRECGAAWRKTPGAIEWLNSASAKRRS